MSGRQRSAGSTGIHDADGLDEYRVDLALASRAVLDTSWDNKKLPWSQRHLAFVHLHGELARDNEEQLVGVVVRVPSKFAVELDDLHFVIVELSHRLGRPQIRDKRDPLREVYRFESHVLQYHSQLKGFQAANHHPSLGSTRVTARSAIRCPLAQKWKQVLRSAKVCGATNRPAAGAWREEGGFTCAPGLDEDHPVNHAQGDTQRGDDHR